MGLPRLTHYRRVLRLYLVQHASFAGLAVGIFVNAEILLGYFVDVSAGAVFGDLDDAAADLDVAVGILGIHQSHGHTRIAADILIFLASLCRIENNVFAIEVAPHRRDLRAAGWHQSAQRGEGALLEQITIFLGNNIRPETSLRSCSGMDSTL